MVAINSAIEVDVTGQVCAVLLVLKCILVLWRTNGFYSRCILSKAKSNYCVTINNQMAKAELFLFLKKVPGCNPDRMRTILLPKMELPIW
jgi:hypothetical protein